ncbi:MAG: hypothetical protein DMG80_20810 [Acidobacteria bacterium]|nr:MAG: hypothetical protein DMG80_20810 [Acidobacteriota bacterium]
MAVRAVHLPSERKEMLLAVAVLLSIGATLIALAPAKDSAQRQNCDRRLNRLIPKNKIFRTCAEDFRFQHFCCPFVVFCTPFSMSS